MEGSLRHRSGLLLAVTAKTALRLIAANPIGYELAPRAPARRRDPIGPAGQLEERPPTGTARVAAATPKAP